MPVLTSEANSERSRNSSPLLDVLKRAVPMRPRACDKADDIDDGEDARGHLADDTSCRPRFFHWDIRIR